MTKKVISLEGGCCVCGSAVLDSYGDERSLPVLCLVSPSHDTLGQGSLTCWLLGGLTFSGPRPCPQVFWE